MTDQKDLTAKQETRLRNAFARYMEAAGQDRAIAVIQLTLHETRYGNRSPKTRQAG